MPEITTDIHERVAAHDAEIAALAGNLNKLTRTVDDGFKNLSEKFDRQVSAGRWSRGDIIGFGGFVIAAVTIASTLIVSRMDGMAAIQTARVEGVVQLQARVNSEADGERRESASDIKSLRDRMTKAEGRFEIVAARADFNQVLLAILWQKATGTDLPAPILPNSTPPMAGDGQ